MGLSEKAKVGLTIISLIIGLSSLGLTIYNRLILEGRIEKLQNTALIGLFSLSDPSLASPLPAKQETIVRGTYVAAIPKDYCVRAVLYSRDMYYVVRPIPMLNLDRTWELLLNLWPGRWQLHLCLCDSEATKTIDLWRGERKRNGDIDYDNPREQLPRGVYLNSKFLFEAR
jgi:hypothetical protein